MRANYSTRRTSVVFNPRGGVFGGLGAEEGYGTGAESYGGDIYGGGDTQAFIDSQIANEAALVAAAQALADADAIAAQIALEASSKQAYEAMASAAAAAARSVKTTRDLVGMIPVVGTMLRAFELVGDFFSQMQAAKTQPGYEASRAAASKALAEASALAAGPGGDSRLVAEVGKLQNSLASLTAANKASSEAAVILLYQTYAKRNPDPASLAYWSNAFGPTITADEVFAFQEALYRNEPNLRPMATATQTTQSSNNLALPIIAAVAGFLLFGS
jgi:hypothetical protein